MEKLKKMLRVLLVTGIVFIVLLLVCTSCSKDPENAYLDAKTKNAITTSEILDLVEGKCRSALSSEISVKDSFVDAFFLDGEYILIHVLTNDNQYLVYTVKTRYSGPITTGLVLGKIPEGYVKTSMTYLENVNPTVENYVIYFD